MTARVAVALIALAAEPALAHRLDEYLQATLVSVERNRMQAQMTLTPGVAVYSVVMAAIDTDGDGVLSPAEQRAYAERVLRDVTLSIDGHRVTPRLVSMDFPATSEMKEGRGEIHIDFGADLPANGPDRKLTLENRHQSRIAAYLVNCLVPRDPKIRIVAQKRNYQQSQYELDYTQGGVGANLLSLTWWSGDRRRLGLIALFLAARFAFLWKQCERPRVA